MSESNSSSDPRPNSTADLDPAIAAAQQTDAPLSPTGDDMQAGPKVKIGTQRPGGQRVKAVAERVLSDGRPSGVKTPVPNIRSSLPDDLEAEVSAALQGMSLNDMVDTAGKSTKLVEIAQDSRRPGRVIKIYQGDVFIELGPNAQGVLPLTNFTEPPTLGQIVEVVVGKFNEEENFYGLSLPNRPTVVGDWSQISEGAIIDVRISGHNKGGLEADVGNLKGFIPAGQVAVYRVEDFSQFVGEKWTVLVTEAKPERRRLVLSRRAVIEREKEEAKTKLMAELQVGDVKEGIVTRIQDFGAFVDIGGVDGLIHVSRLAWNRVKHPSEVLSTGDKVKVKVVNIDPASGKIGLSLRDLLEDPWKLASYKYKQGDVIRGPVVRTLDKVGAFVQLEPGIDGLVHISELAHQRVWRVSDFLKEGQEIEAKVLSVDLDQKRISLSMKALSINPEVLKKQAEEEAEENAPVIPLPPQPKNLKGGMAKKKGGAQFGLNW
ncbi:MAG: S1 RNA-binding domain-containing protein [Planctomycetia bacterium]|nr:S1 RNA-binding domain-containing protein [Planctomycetia bacterium]